MTILFVSLFSAFTLLTIVKTLRNGMRDNGYDPLPKGLTSNGVVNHWHETVRTMRR